MFVTRINIIPAAKRPTIFLGFNGKRWHLLVISPTISTLFSNWSKQGYRNLYGSPLSAAILTLTRERTVLNIDPKIDTIKNGNNRRWIIVELKNLFQLAERYVQ